MDYKIEEVIQYITITRPELLHAAVRRVAPYLIEIDQHVKELGHGTLSVEINVRAGSVEKMAFTEKKTWLKEKALDSERNP